MYVNHCNINIMIFFNTTIYMYNSAHSFLLFLSTIRANDTSCTQMGEVEGLALECVTPGTS